MEKKNLTGVGKSQFLNALTDSSRAKISYSGNSHTQDFEVIPINFRGKILKGIDTPGLSDSKDNSKKIKLIKRLLCEYPKIQKLIIVKKYNDIRLDSGIQDALKVFMESFPLRNFWDFVIIVNTWSDPDSRAFKYFKKNVFKVFSDKVNDCQKLKNFMNVNNINYPKSIKEYFVESKFYKEIEGMGNILNEIKISIAEGKKMFKKVEKSVIKYEIINQNDEDILKKSQTMTYIHFNGDKVIKNILNETEKIPSYNCIFKYSELKEEFEKEDSVKFYDILSFGISWAARKKRKYNIYKRNIYEINYRNQYGPWHYKYSEWK